MDKQCRAPTAAELAAQSQCRFLDTLLARPPLYSSSLFGPMTCQAQPTFDAFDDVLNGEFELDDPVAAALFRQQADIDPDAVALMLAASVPPSELPKTSQAAETMFRRLWGEIQDSTVGGGNILGNTASVSEAAVLGAWKRLASKGFSDLVSGKAEGAVRIGKHIVVTTHKIGLGGELRKGARLKVRISGMPMSVMQELPKPVMLTSSNKVGAIRIGALDMSKANTSAHVVASTRWQSSKALRVLSGKPGVGVLAFGPSAAIDFYDSAEWRDGRMEVNWNGFAVRSAESQSGNLVGVVAGAGAAAGAVAVGVVAAVGWPVVLVGLGAGVVAQVAWGYFGADKAAGRAVERALK